MKKNRILCVILAAFLTASFSGCRDNFDISFPWNSDYESESDSDSEESEESDETKDSEKYSYPSVEEVKDHADTLINDSEIPDSPDIIHEDMDTLLNDLDAVSEALSYLTMDYYTDWYNERLEAKYDSCYEDYYVMYELLAYAFSNAYSSGEYNEMLEPYIDAEALEYYTQRSLSMNRLEGYARTDYKVMDEYLDEYYDIAYDEDMDSDEKSLKAAEIYIDLLSAYEAETFYDGYNRDFSPEEIMNVSKFVKNELIDAEIAMEAAFENIPHLDDVNDNPILFDNDFEVIGKYAPKLSDDIDASAKRLLDEELYITAGGRNSYTGSFTIDLPVQNSALIYHYKYDDAYDLLTAIHEFGHFHASYYDDTTTYLVKNNIDIAEIQSQGMEMIFMEHYDDIFANQAEATKMLKLYDTLDAAISGFLVGEFEYTILKNLDTVTPEEVVECFESLMEENGYDVSIYEIDHIFSQPGYYISYGVSALAALDIWQTSLSDTDKAIEMYENIARVKSNSDEYQFKSALQECGFDDVLTESYISSLGNTIIDIAEKYD